MQRKKSKEQAITWLTSIANLRDSSLDSINAKLCLNLINGLEKQLNSKGVVIYQLKKALKEKNIPEPVLYEQMTIDDYLK